MKQNLREIFNSENDPLKCNPFCKSFKKFKEIEFDLKKLAETNIQLKNMNQILLKSINFKDNKIIELQKENKNLKNECNFLNLQITSKNKIIFSDYDNNIKTFSDRESITMRNSFIGTRDLSSINNNNEIRNKIIDENKSNLNDQSFQMNKNESNLFAKKLNYVEDKNNNNNNEDVSSSSEKFKNIFNGKKSNFILNPINKNKDNKTSFNSSSRNFINEDEREKRIQITSRENNTNLNSIENNNINNIEKEKENEKIINSIQSPDSTGNIKSPQNTNMFNNSIKKRFKTVVNKYETLIMNKTLSMGLNNFSSSKKDNVKTEDFLKLRNTSLNNSPSKKNIFKKKLKINKK